MVLLLLTFCLWLLPLFNVFLYVTLCPFEFCNHLDGEKELVALLSLSSWCLVIVVWLFLAVPWACLRFVIVVFPDHTHYFKAFPNKSQSAFVCQQQLSEKF